jgi:hypothetical protein
MLVRQELAHHQPALRDEHAALAQERRIRDVAIVGESWIVRVVDGNDRHGSFGVPPRGWLARLRCCALYHQPPTFFDPERLREFFEERRDAGAPLGTLPLGHPAAGAAATRMRETSRTT